MAEDHAAPEADNYAGPEPEVVRRQRVAKMRAAQKSWTVQNEMKGVLGWRSASAA